ncbi:alpha/beta hydrolase [Planococcus maritimus]|uniref:alpha/beta fold hydrolase n=1 Tax=Planococcus maritimus TaxID=192421 RepID=UPI00080EEED0|nr:alpha/beta hydrolase [Planococcus maritimus]ANU18433.1 alpha/beta hydrolase [Planococcus maritimus]
MTKQLESRCTDIGGIQLYCKVLGEDTDGPVIVFDSGYGVPTRRWNSIKTEVSSFSKLLIYDRAGLGRSTLDSRPRHSLQHVENLRNLLQKKEVKPPYMLVGHSFGGLNVRLYASMYPEEIAGLILLDSCHEDQNKLMAEELSSDMQADYYGQFGAEGTLAEFEQSLEQVRKYKTLGDMPLTVVTGGNQPDHTEESWGHWMDFQKGLAALSTKSRHVVLTDVGHSVHIDNPEAVVQEIRKMYAHLKDPAAEFLKEN